MIPRCQVIPLEDSQFSFQVAGRELTRWNAAARYQRPYFFPVSGPSQALMTRMGHPGAPDHDHHASIWFAHHKVLGIDFWSMNATSQIRQLRWHAIRDGQEDAVLAVQLGWFDGHNPAPLLEQELVICVSPAADGEDWTLELQSRFVPVAESLEFQQTNFGFLAVRVAKSISATFGGGRLTNSENVVGEKDLFAKPARWMDYSGTVQGSDRQEVAAGITYFDHPNNPGSPVSWHVREDGWMGAGACLNNPIIVSRDQPLLLRYLLNIHAGAMNPTACLEVLDRWIRLPEFVIEKSKRRSEHFDVFRRAVQ